MKSIYQLLIMLKARLEYVDKFWGLCSVLDTYYHWTDDLSRNDYDMLKNYIKEHKPWLIYLRAIFGFYDPAYYWRPGKKKPRLKWLNKHIALNEPKSETVARILGLVKYQLENDPNFKRLEKGLCFTISELNDRDIITNEEFHLVKKYLFEHQPKYRDLRALLGWYEYAYYWRPGAKRPRLKWLEKHIKRNS